MQILPVLEIMALSDAHQRAAYAPEYEAGSAYVLDHFCPISQAAVPITDTGFIHADAAYDVVTSSKGFFFRLDDHLDRFEQSCEIFQLRNPFTRTETSEILTRLVQLAGFKDAYIWWCVTRGDFPAGPNKTSPEAYQNRFFAFVVSYRFMADDAMRSRGIDVIVSKEIIRIPSESVDPRAKNFHWMDMKQSMFEAGSQGYDWSVLTDGKGHLTEAPGCNIFVLHGNTLATPDSGCLEGITRKTALELAQEINLLTEVRPVLVDELLDADAAFLCSSAGGIMPINSADGIVLGGSNGPGKVVTELHNLYWEKRWSGWHGLAINYEE
jgi:branched-chain amino acid aminotransferase